MTRAKAIKYALRMGFTAEERKAIRRAWQPAPHARGELALCDANKMLMALMPIGRLERLAEK